MDSNDGDRTLTLDNVQIYNSSNVGLLARTGDVYGENVVINNSGQSSLACSLGGRYNFNHCTFANYWTNGFRTFPTVQIDNFIQISETETQGFDLLEANFTNCVIYGNEQREIALLEDTSAAFNFSFTNSLIRFEDPNGDFTDNPNSPADRPRVTRSLSAVLDADGCAASKPRPPSARRRSGGSSCISPASSAEVGGRTSSE